MDSASEPTVLILLLLLGLLLISTYARRSSERAPVATSLHPWTDILRAGVLNCSPPLACCIGFCGIKNLETSLGFSKTFQSVRNCLIVHIFKVVRKGGALSTANPSSQFQCLAAADISSLLQVACNVHLGFSLDPNVPC